jgi:1,4-alpha-glucan branching enzyme
MRGFCFSARINSIPVCFPDFNRKGDSKMSFGTFVLMLHSHLPYYRKHGMWPCGEESLYECMAETYLPLLNALSELKDEGIKAKVTLGITPILAEQLADPYLQNGFIEFLNARLKAAREDVKRYPDPAVPHSEHLAYLANWYVQYYECLLEDFENRYHRNLLAGFKRLQDEDCIEITTSGATHGFSPLLGTSEAVNTQFKVGVETYKRHFGREPKGVWLPECAYAPERKVSGPSGETSLFPSTDAFLYENNLKYFFTEYHAIEGGVSAGARRVVGIYGNIQYIPLPERPATGLTTDEAYWMKDYPVAVMGRNDRASFQVWSAAHGYPGDGVYREFHKKDDKSGLHYWRLTSKDCELGDKMLYDPVLAEKQTHTNSDHFANLIYHQLKDHYESTGQHGLVMVSFDTELYGHWWFEGVTWLKQVIRKIHQCEGVEFSTASEYLDAYPPQTAIELPESTWGQGGHYWVWQNHHTEWMWPQIHSAESKMKDLAERHQNEENSTKIKLLNQILRELLLLESSDWPFLVTTFQAKDYAIERFNEHKDRFWALVSMLESGNIDQALFDQCLDEDNPFAAIDFRWYAYHHRPELEVAV